MTTPERRRRRRARRRQLRADAWHARDAQSSGYGWLAAAVLLLALGAAAAARAGWEYLVWTGSVAAMSLRQFRRRREAQRERAADDEAAS